MPAIPPDLINRLRTALSRCNALSSDRALRDLFVDARLAPWRNRVPENTLDRETRVNALISTLCDQTVANGDNALVLCLRVLSENAPAGDALRNALATLADEIAADPAPPIVETPPECMAAPSGNPFGIQGRITDPAQFFDREELLRQIFEELVKGNNLSLVGASQIGKSSLLTRLCALGPARLNLPAAAFAYLSLEWVDDENEFYEALSESLGLPEALRGYKLTRALRGQRRILCLDEIEKMAWDGFTARVRSQLRGLADGPDAPLRLVIASRSPLARLFPDTPELDSPLAGICQTIAVNGFAPETACAWINARLRGAGVTFAQVEVERLIAETGGHPARLQQAAAALYAQKSAH